LKKKKIALKELLSKRFENSRKFEKDHTLKKNNNEEVFNDEETLERNLNQMVTSFSKGEGLLILFLNFISFP